MKKEVNVLFLISLILIISLSLLSAKQTTYIYAGNKLVAKNVDGVINYVIEDNVGSSAVITDSQGNKIQEFSYDAFGASSSEDASYTGHVKDNETGLIYARARFYDPSIGRFISADSMMGNPADPQSLNRYTYVKNNPLKYVDPSGMEDKTPSQIRVETMIGVDSNYYNVKGMGLYTGDKKMSDQDTSLIYVDCVNSILEVLSAEMSEKEVKEIRKNSLDSEGKFSTPLTLAYLVNKKGWTAIAVFDPFFREDYSTAQTTGIYARDVWIFRDKKSGKWVYQAGQANFPVDMFISMFEADTLFKEKVQNSFAIGVQRGGEHSYSIIQGGLFDIHFGAPPLGRSSATLDILDIFHTLDLHRGRYAPYSSVSVFAFPPEKDDKK